MKRLSIFIALVLAAVLLRGAWAADAGREEKPRFKGVEMYSWKDAKGRWVFAVLSGTNRQKPEKLVKDPKNRIEGVANVKKSLARLAVDEQVFWIHRMAGFSYPPKKIRDDIQKSAAEAKVKLHISTPKDDTP